MELSDEVCPELGQTGVARRIGMSALPAHGVDIETKVRNVEGFDRLLIGKKLGIIENQGVNIDRDKPAEVFNVAHGLTQSFAAFARGGGRFCTAVPRISSGVQDL